MNLRMLPNLSKEELKKRIDEQDLYKAQLRKIELVDHTERYGRSPGECMENYKQLMMKHYKQEAAYYPWLPDVDGSNHMCITGTGYKYLEPTQEELEAFRLVYGKEMKYPKPEEAILRHHWGN
jgi:hypothetical protein